MCEWRVFLPEVLPSDEGWADSSSLNQYKSSLTALKKGLSDSLEGGGYGSIEERTDQYYVGSDDVGLKYRAGKHLEVKIRDGTSQMIPGAEHWGKFKLKRGPVGSVKYQKDIDEFTNHNERIELSKSRQRGSKKADLCVEKTIVKIAFPSTSPSNALASTYYCGRQWVTICVEGQDDAVLQALQNSHAEFRVALLKTCVLECLRIRFANVPKSCRESFFPILAGYPTFIHMITRPAKALLPQYVVPLLTLLDLLPGSDTEDYDAVLALLPDYMYSEHAKSNPLLAKYMKMKTNSSADYTWRSCPPSPVSSQSHRLVPYVSHDISSPAEIVDPIRSRRNGSLLNLDRILLHSPQFARGWNSLFGELRGSNISISPKYKELAICVVAVLNDAEYEFYQHYPPWVSAGATDIQALTLRLLGGGNHIHFLEARQNERPLLNWECFDGVEMDVIQLAVEMTKNIKTSKSVMKRLQSSLEGNAGLVEITGVIAGYNMVSRFLVAMDITAEGECSM